jgi:hypothetical protein
VVDGDRVEIDSDHGTIPAVIRCDGSLRLGVVSMTHGWGGLPEDDHFAVGVGSNVGLLIDGTTDLQAWSLQPRMTAIPVDIRKPEAGDRDVDPEPIG